MPPRPFRERDDKQLSQTVQVQNVIWKFNLGILRTQLGSHHDSKKVCQKELNAASRKLNNGSSFFKFINLIFVKPCLF